MSTALLALSAIAFNAPNAPLPLRVAAACRPAVRGGMPCAQDLDTVQDLASKQAAAPVGISWIETESGFKYIEEVVGTGPIPKTDDVVQLHYTVTLLSSGTTLGTTRGVEPLLFAVGKHKVPVWDEALQGMRVGGQRRMIVPPSAIPYTQVDKVPGEERSLRFDFELVGLVDPADLKAVVARKLPPAMARLGVGRLAFIFLWLLSFVPYAMPVEQQPGWYHDGLTREEILARREARVNNNFLGGDMQKLNELFPEEDALP